MEKGRLTRVILFSDLWDIFKRRWWVMLVVGVLAVDVFWAYNRLTFEPQYASTATLYILRQNEMDSNSEKASDFSLALNVVNDCTFLLKSHAVVDKVMEDLQLDMSYKDLYKSISTKNPDNTRILEVTVIAPSSKQAKEIVDHLCEVGAEKIEEAMGFRQVNLFEYGTYETIPANQVRVRTYAIIMLAAVLLVYILQVILFIMDDTLNSSEDIEKYLDIKVIGDIPYYGEGGRGAYGYGYGYGYGKSSKKASQKGESK